MRKKLFIKNVMIMSFSALLIRCIGMLFAVKTAGIMGAEMLGRFRLVLCVYALFLLTSTSGTGITVTRIAGDLFACRKDAQACFVRDRAAGFSFLLGTAAGLLMLLSDAAGYMLGGSELFSAAKVAAAAVDIFLTVLTSAVAVPAFFAVRKTFMTVYKMLFNAQEG